MRGPPTYLLPTQHDGPLILLRSGDAPDGGGGTDLDSA